MSKKTLDVTLEMASEIENGVDVTLEMASEIENGVDVTLEMPSEFEKMGSMFRWANPQKRIASDVNLDRGRFGGVIFSPLASFGLLL